MRQFIAILSALVIISACLFIVFHPKIRDTKANIRDAFDATCVINDGGTGVILESGYILTAAHVVDSNSDKKISNSERFCTAVFGDGNSYRARVTYFGQKDFALLSIIGDRPMKIKPSKRPSEVGERIYTIGATAGHKPHITEGYVSTPDIGHGRASCYISGGNSGGAIFNQDNEHMGIVVAVGMRRGIDMIRFPVTIEDKTYFVTGTVMRSDEISSLCLFLPMEDVRRELSTKGLEFILDIPAKPSTLDKFYTPMTTGILFTFFQIYLFLVFVFYVRKHLFS